MFSDFYTPPCIVTFAVAETYRYLAWLKSNYNAWFDIRNIMFENNLNQFVKCAATTFHYILFFLQSE